MYVANKAGYLRSAARDPFELARVLRCVLATGYFRFVRRCAGRGSIFGMHNQIINARNVRIGSGCFFQDWIYVRAGVNGRVTIDDRVAINSFCQLYGHGGITIGADTQIGPGVLITTTGHHYTQHLETSFKPVRVGRGVWIGAKVIVLPGVTIGDGAVIGAGAVVNRDIPARVLAAGVPVRVIRSIDAGEDKADASRPDPEAVSGTFSVAQPESRHASPR
jgi:acetyltransferase-like isoleucine patch superfamily enzyme